MFLRIVSHIICLLIILVLTGCVPKYSYDQFPTTGPVKEQLSGQSLLVELSASTNCIISGETVQFTLQITNTLTSPIILNSDSPLEIVIQAPSSSVLINSEWSDDNQFIHDIDPILQGGEVRTYRWRWEPDSTYSTIRPPNTELNISALIMYDAAPNGNWQREGQSMPLIGISYGYMRSTLYQKYIECDQIR